MVCIFSFYATDPSVIRLLFVRANQKTLTLTTFGAILSSSHSVNQKYFLRKELQPTVFVETFKNERLF